MAKACPAWLKTIAFNSSSKKHAGDKKRPFLAVAHVSQLNMVCAPQF